MAVDINDFNDFNDFPVFNPEFEGFVFPRCDYIGIDDLYPFITGLSLSILMFNIRSQKQNFNAFLSKFSDCFNYFSVIALTETWLTVDRDCAFSIPGFYSFNLYRNQYGGGLRFYFRDCFRTRILKDFTFINDFFEILSVELDMGRSKYVLVLVYHPPSSSVQRNIEFVYSLTSTLKNILKLGLQTIVMGDMNLNVLNPENLTYIETFIDNMFELGLYLAITRPTRISITNQRLCYSVLDQIWTTHKANPVRSFIFPTNITDHFPVVSIIENVNHNNNIPKEIELRVFSGANKEAFKFLLTSLKILTHSTDFNHIFNAYYKELFLAYEIAFPVIKQKIKIKRAVPWMTAKLKKCIQEKEKLYKKFLKGKVQRSVYTSFRNKLTNIIRRVKSLYYAKLFFENAGDSKKLWSILNGLLDRRSKNTLKELVVDGERLSGNLMANYVNNYFINIAIAIRDQTQQSLNFRCLAPWVESSCFFFPTNFLEVSLVIKKLKNKGSKLLDIHASLIKDNIDTIGAHMVTLYNMSLGACIFPEPLKVARVTPTYKSGDVMSVDNYRPISSLPVVSKLFERLTLNRMLGFIDKNNILNAAQFGFRKGRDVTQAVVKLTTLVIQAYHSKLFCACFFLDLRKAFDTVSHKLLLRKLYHYGFRGDCLEYLKSYFHNRKQFVFLDRCSSESGSVVCGVPQGSILGPICFSIFINDLPFAVKVDSVLFADDAAFVITSDTQEGLIVKIRELFSDLSNYLNLNQLIPNSRKSKLMMFRSRTFTDLPEINFFGQNIEWVLEFKYLGITLSNNMSFAKHINTLSTKLSQITGTFISLKNFVPIHILCKLYYALVYPHLNLNIVIWGSAPEFHIRPLKTRLNNLLRLILGVTWENNRPNCSTADLFKILSFLNIFSIFKLNLFKFLKLILDGNLPIFYNLLLARYETPHGYSTRRMGFRCPNVTCEIERRGLSYQLILLLEELPAGLINMSYTSAVKHLKRALLNGQ